MNRLPKFAPAFLPVLFLVVTLTNVAVAVPLPTPRPYDLIEDSKAGAPLSLVPNRASSGQPAPAAAQPVVPTPQRTAPAANAAPRRNRDLSPISAHDKALTKEALGLIREKKFGAALARQLAISHPLARGLVEFFYVRDRARDAGYSRIAEFISAYPNWPSRNLLRLRLAQAMMEDNAPPADVIRHLGQNPPTGSGHIVLAAAYAASGDKRRAAQLARAAWHRDGLDAEQERWAMNKLGRILGPEDHRIRMEMYFYRDRSADGSRVAGYLGKDWRAYAQARTAVIKRARDAGKKLNAVPRRQHRQPGYVFAQIQYLRRSGKELEAASVLANAPRDPAVLVDPDEWWVERRLAARNLLDAGSPSKAYEIAAAHSARDSGDYAEAEFHAGWIALRFLNDPRRAMRHFANIGKVATIPTTKARSSYWLGRAAEAAGDSGGARRHFGVAAGYGTAFYGQLAAAKLGNSRPTIGRKPGISRAGRRQFDQSDGPRAVRLLKDIGYRSLAASMLGDMAEHSRSAEETALIGELSAELGLTHMVVHAGKRGQARGYQVDRVAFPTNGVPKFRKLSTSVEPALVHAISRQESLFNPRARSHADARGLMQLLPSTAAGVAKRNGVGYSKRKLYDPAYNAQLGAAYLGENVGKYNGSYILAIAAYNAGRRRANEWMQRFGDPRTRGVDPVDWIERIPFTETREYVQKVLENLQVYRAILPGVDGRLAIGKDLTRGG